MDTFIEFKERGRLYLVLNKKISTHFFTWIKNHYDGLETADFESHLVSFTKENGSLALKHLFGLSKQTNLVRIQLEHLLHSELVATETIVAKASYMPELTQESLEFEVLDSLFQKLVLSLKLLMNTILLLDLCQLVQKLMH